MNLIREIDRFWTWANKTPQEYSANRGSGEWECEYPDWMDLYRSVDLAIEQLNIKYNEELTESLLQGLAVDNESELILEKVDLRLNDKSTFIEQVITSSQPQAKWQIAELLKSVELGEAKEYLVRLISDENKYVKRRALISLNKIDEQESMNQAKKFINDVDDYLRVVALDILDNRMEH